MTTPSREFTPERCRQLRERGILRLMINLLHEHTFEPENNSEADFSIEPFLTDFNRRAERRAQISLQLHTILVNTGNNEDELTTLEMLTLLRIYIQELYSIIGDWETITGDANTLNERADRLSELAVLVTEAFVTFGPDTGKDTIRPIINQLGGAFVIVDYLRAQTRFNTKCHQFESDLIDSTSLLRVVNDSKLGLLYAVGVLYSVSAILDSNDDIKLFLGNSRSLHEIMVGIVEDAYDDGAFPFVKFYCRLLYSLYYTEDLIDPTSTRLSTSHLAACGVIKCLAKFGMNTKDPQTLYYVLDALVAPLMFDRQNALEFVSIDGAVDMLIDGLVPSKEKDEDVENADRYERQRCALVTVLHFVFGHLDIDSPEEQQLLTIFESRDLVVILVRYLEQITSSDAAMCVLALLRNTLQASDDQHQKFAEMVRGRRVVKRFESCDNELSARAAKQIAELFE